MIGTSYSGRFLALAIVAAALAGFVRAKSREGHGRQAKEERPSAEVIDLMAVLRKSLKSGSGSSRSKRKAA